MNNSIVRFGRIKKRPTPRHAATNDEADKDVTISRIVRNENTE